MAAKKAVKAKRDAVLVQARALKKGEVQQLRFEPLEAKRACRAGLAWLERRSAALKRACPGIALDELRLLPELCDRVVAAQRDVAQARGTNGADVKSILSTASSWRRRLLPLAESLAEAGRVDARELARIRAGKGATDTLRDVAELAALLGPHEKVAEQVLGAGALKSAATAAEASQAALGTGGGDVETARQAADLRDRYATLIAVGHDRLRTAVAVLASYREAERIVPSLAGATGGGRAGKVAPMVPTAPPSP